MAITPDMFATLPCPSYPEIRLALMPGRRMAAMIRRFHPCVIHIATEGPLGMAARRYCVRRNIPFTTAYHTRFPEYVHARTGLPERITYRFIRWFHGPSRAVMVPTPTVVRDLEANGIGDVRLWTRGVDTQQFQPQPGVLDHLPKPIQLYVGRVAVEKNIEAFLSIENAGSKVVVGGGPALEKLKAAYPDVHFLGPKTGADLSALYASADVFVFPSLTDTFGLVLLEALASGVPVAAYPVTGPVDVIGDAPVGCLHDDLGTAIDRALTADRQACRDFALDRSWDASARQFLANVRPFDADRLLPQDAGAPEPVRVSTSS